jgi:ABC-type antimicrobial peptide transport system permease subunit
VRQSINQIDARLPIFSVTTLSEQVEGTLKQDRLIAQLVSFFGGLALMLAAIGLYGVMSQGVARRTNEIGIRMALGAERSHIAWMVLRETLFLVISGLVIGVPTALLAARLISNQLFGLGASDPLTLIGAAIGLTVVAMLAGYLPARRATKVNPLVALRYE